MYIPEESKEYVKIGDNYYADENVVIGYIPGRKIDDLTIVLGDGFYLRTGTVIYAGSKIGKNLQTGHNVVIREENLIGDGLSIWNNSIIDYGCTIGSRVRIHNNVYVAQYTTIEDDVFLAPGVTIANDPHPICTLCMKGPTIKKGARIGINASLMSHITIGEFALVGAGSTVIKDVPPKTVVAGNPASIIKKIDDLTCPFDLVKHPYLDGYDVYLRGIKK
ncbi:MAG: acyltransferase [Candidatus Aminicenantaceae bacterium]